MKFLYIILGIFPHFKMFNDIRDPIRKKIKNFWQNIREPQWEML